MSTVEYVWWWIKNILLISGLMLLGVVLAIVSVFTTWSLWGWVLVSSL